ncbi:alpha/beta fold hydrolase [Pseudonocardia sediminis]|uniref:alpha/beta fold hydrolase n=1 Tax=Pseudonocardia sediminis TaxID=1397368 RepID=UPI001F5EF101|nr:alpha/beta hydrolase [Pseudonocardia sediminis]
MRRTVRSSDGVALEVVEFGGDGTPVVLLHGLMGRATTWWPVARELTRHGRVLGLDARGHGRSERPATDAWDPQRMAADVVELVEGLDAGPVALIGHSMGGLHALLAAAARPDLVRALVVEDMAVDLTGLSPHTVDDMHAWFSAIPQPQPSLAAVREAFGHPYPEAGDYMSECVVERADGYHLLTDVTDATTIAAHWTRTAHRDAVEALAAARIPTLLIEAGQSITPPGQLAAVAARIPGARHLRIEGTGHLVHAAAPEAYLDAVHDLLART